MNKNPLNFKTSLSGTYRPKFGESSFVLELESTLTTRPLILYFIVDASHSMRFYIDQKKTIQRQTIVQSVTQMGINNSSIIKDGDYVCLATFSTDVKKILESTEDSLIEVNEQTRNDLSDCIIKSLKSDGGKTNYGKAFDFLLNSFNQIKDKFPVDSPHLMGPILVWFLTDGRPWPDDIKGNTEDDIFSYAKKIGETGNELWIIGISTDASQEFLNRIAFASQEGASSYQTSLQDVPKEFMLEENAQNQTLWVDLDFKSQERLIHGLVNAIERARHDLGTVPEIELTFYSEDHASLEFTSGINYLERQEGGMTVITLKRPTTLRIGQKLSMAFSLESNNTTIEQTKLISIKTKLYRGKSIISQQVEKIDKPLKSLLKQETKTFKGAESVRADLFQVRKQLLGYKNQMNDLLVTLEALNLSEHVSEYSRKLSKIDQLLAQKKGIATRIN